MSATLPTWADMTDLDKGAALLHLHKRDYEGAAYAMDNYPAEYFDHPALTALDAEEACDHAVTLRVYERALEPAEYGRLYDAALAADDARLRERLAAARSAVSE